MTHIQMSRRKWAFAFIITVAILIRFAAAWPLAHLHSDEVGQYLEQAHRLVFGYGAIPWEYREGMRSWFVPLILVGPMALGDAVGGPGSLLYLHFPKFLVALCSLPILWAAWTFGRRVSEPHGWVAVIAAAVWYEFVHGAAHTLTEPLATAAILPAAALLLSPRGNEALDRRRFALAGFLLGLGCILRFHYGPAVAIIALVALKGQWRTGAVPIILGGLGAALISACVDIGSGALPFSWIVTNIRFNIVHDIASEFVVLPPTAYLGEFILKWGWMRIPIFLCILPAIKYHRPLFWVAIVNLLLHSLIGHKEYRFIFLTMVIFIILAAIGSVEIIRFLANRFKPTLTRWSAAVGGLFWISLSLSLAATEPRRAIWTRYAPTQTLVAKAGQLPETCGFAFEQTEFWTSGSYSVFHRNVPFYLEPGLDPSEMKSGRTLQAAAGYNSLVGPETLRPLLPKSYRAVECRPAGAERDLPAYAPDTARVCLFHRPGPCTAQGLEKHRVQDVLQSLRR